MFLAPTVLGKEVLVGINAYIQKNCNKDAFDAKLQSDDREHKRTVIKKLGADLKLSGRTIQFTPVKYLVPIEKQYPELRCQFDVARTTPQQMKKTLLGT